MSEIVPFGKYKGKPVEILAEDRQYAEWLANQDWFRDKYQNIYTLIINNFGEPTETPEHNALQAKFLDQCYCAAVVDCILPGRETLFSCLEEFSRSGPPIQILNCQFEVGGADVVFVWRLANSDDALQRRLQEKKIYLDSVVKAKELDVNNKIEELNRPYVEWRKKESVYDAWEGKKKSFDCYQSDPKWRQAVPHPGPEPEKPVGKLPHYYWSSGAQPPPVSAIEDRYRSIIGEAKNEVDRLDALELRQLKAIKEWDTYAPESKIVLELKPNIGDDYPAVLRQALRLRPDRFGLRSRIVVIAQSYVGVGADVDQVREIFRSSGIYFLLLQEVESVRKNLRVTP